MKKVSLSPEDFLASLPEDAGRDMQKLDKACMSIFSSDERVMWRGKLWGGTDQTIIGYGDWSYVRSDKKTVTWFKVGLALQKNYISVYINAVEGGQYVAKKYADTLGKVKIGSSSVSFKKLEDVNLNALLKLIKIAKKQTV
jgi:hypothetical protein